MSSPINNFLTETMTVTEVAVWFFKSHWDFRGPDNTAILDLTAEPPEVAESFASWYLEFSDDGNCPPYEHCLALVIEVYSKMRARKFGAGVGVTQ